MTHFFSRLASFGLLGFTALSLWQATPAAAQIAMYPGPEIDPELPLCNLVPNGDFEQQNHPFVGIGNGNIGPNGANDLAGWNTLNSSDYMAASSAGGAITLASGLTVTPHSGKGIAGLYSSFNGGDNYTLTGPLEYITRELTTNPAGLAAGRYYACFYAWFPATTNYPTKLGLEVYSAAPSLNTNYAFTPRDWNRTIQSPTTVSAVNGWSLVNGLLTLNGGERHITVGNMSPMQYHPMPYNGNDGAYYFIDDVALYRLPEAGLADIYLTCNSKPPRLGTGCANIPGAAYQWFIGSRPVANAIQPTLTLTANPTTVTTYTLQVTLPIVGGAQSYSSNVTVYPAPAPVANTAPTICSGTATTLTPTCQSGDYTYTWLEGPAYTTVVSTGYTATVQPALTTTYKLIVTPVRGGASTESLATVTVIPTPGAPQLTLVSNDGCTKVAKYRIDNFNSAFTYSLGNLVNLSSAQGTIVSSNQFTLQGTASTGSFELTASNGCGTVAAPVSLVFGPATVPPSPSLGPGREVACQDVSQYFTIVDFDPMLTYHVVAYGANAIPSTLGAGNISRPNQSEFRIKGGSGATSATFTITASNACGTSPVQGPGDEYDATFPNCRSAAVPTYELFPNPATDEVLIQPASLLGAAGKQTSMAEGITSIQVIDGYGQLRLTQQVDKVGAVRLRVGQLRSGLYIVRLLRGQTVISSQHLQITK